MDEQEYIQLIAQPLPPPDVVADIAQLSYDANGDIYIKLHLGGDPGYNVTYQIIDLLYGVVPWSVKAIPDGTQTIIMNATVFTCTPDEATEWSTGGGFAGQIVLFKVDNTAGVQIDFNTGFTDVDSILPAETGIQTRLLYFDGTTWRQITTGGGGSLPSITENQTLRGNSSNEIEANNYLKIHEDGAEITVSNNTDEDSRVPNLAFFETNVPIPDPDGYVTRTALIEYEEGSSGWNLIDDNAYGYLAGDISSDGSICYFTDERRLYRYDGVTITEIRPDGDRDGLWISVACSADGSFIVVCEYNHRIWISNNFGANFAETRPDGDRDHAWKSVDCDSDGSFLLACYGPGGSVYISSNSGTNWANTGLTGEYGWWFCVACDSDGSNLIVVENNGYVQISTNNGVSWSEKKPNGAGTFHYQSCGISADGLVMVVAVYGGRIRYSVNSGTDWAETQPDGNRNGYWGSYGRFACNSDGSVILIYEDDARLWKSVNSCVSWVEVQPDGDINGAWSCIALDNNTGSIILAGDWYSGKIFIYLVEASIIKSIRVKRRNDWMLYTPEGGGTPGGSDTQVQFNDADKFGGDKGFIYDKASGKVTITNINVSSMSKAGFVKNDASGNLTGGESGGSAYTVVDPISLTGTEIGFKYDIDDFQLNGAGELEFIGSGTPPGGLNTYIQYNDDGLFSGEADFTYNKGTNTQTVVNISAKTIKALDGDGISLREDSGTYGVGINDAGDMTVKLGDKAGVRKVIIQDSDGAVILTIDSDGHLDGVAEGFTPDGNTAKITNMIGGTGLPPATAPEGTVYLRRDA